MFEWGEPPKKPIRRYKRRKRVKYESVIRLLRMNPNCWAKVAEFDTHPQAHSASLRLRRGKRLKKVVAGVGEIESITRVIEDGKVGVWARVKK